MKIEKISENQIRCTLNREDLVNRELRISELAYGTEKSKALFRDMMQQANYEFGFETKDIPLMIEAIPVSPECLVLVITKVEDPEELDTRFSNFSPDGNYEDDDDLGNPFHSFDEEDDVFEDYLDDNEDDDDSNSFLPFLKKERSKKGSSDQGKSLNIGTNIVKVYTFQSLNDVIQMSSVVTNFYEGKNSLYKNPVNAIYYLILNKSDYSSDDFSEISNIVSEYGNQERSTYASSYHYDEHFELIIKDNAIQVLANL